MNEIKTIALDEAKSPKTGLKYEIIEESNSFITDDIIAICKHIGFDYDKIINIHHLYVAPEDRGSNFGNNLWAMFLMEENVLNSKTIVLLKSAPLMFDYPIEPNEEQRNFELVRQGTFIETCLAMRNIQSVCGFENSIPYIYPTPEIKILMEAIIMDEISSPKNKLGGNVPVETKRTRKVRKDQDHSIAIIFKDIKDFDRNRDNYIFIKNANKDVVRLLCADMFNNYERYNPNGEKIINFYSNDIELFVTVDDFCYPFSSESKDAPKTDIDWTIYRLGTEFIFKDKR